MADPYIGEIRAFGFNFAPYEWASCSGQIVPIGQNTALYSILGTQFGGNGQSTFGLPNLNGVAVRGQQNNVLNDLTGVESVALTSATVPPHTHTIVGRGGRAAEKKAAGNLPGQFVKSTKNYTVASSANLQLNPALVSPFIGNSQPHENRQPLLVMNFCISLYGIYPPRP
ncbi:phage tail protein [Undibacterium squillarum]|jgi:microcystin-dependent protein|uniref:phage tail protein n=1 Tax=Undibacterium squillarum TaxID=1131567 RepID=UPI0035B1EA7B